MINLREGKIPFSLITDILDILISVDMKTHLENGNLWYDGTMEVSPDGVIDLILQGLGPSRISVTNITPEIKQYNLYSMEAIRVKNENLAWSKEWLIPREYHKIDIPEYVTEVLSERIKYTSNYDLAIRAERLIEEMNEFEKRDLFDFLRVLIYIFDTLKKNRVIWGVGRGSSCSSYLLYLVGVHSVDPVKYKIPLSDFLK